MSGWLAWGGFGPGTGARGHIPVHIAGWTDRGRQESYLLRVLELEPPYRLSPSKPRRRINPKISRRTGKKDIGDRRAQVRRAGGLMPTAVGRPIQHTDAGCAQPGPHASDATRSGEPMPGSTPTPSWPARTRAYCSVPPSLLDLRCPCARTDHIAANLTRSDGRISPRQTDGRMDCLG